MSAATASARLAPTAIFVFIVMLSPPGFQHFEHGFRVQPTYTQPLPLSILIAIMV